MCLNKKRLLNPVFGTDNSAVKRLPVWEQQSMLFVKRANTKNAASFNADFVGCIDKNSGAKIMAFFGNANFFEIVKRRTVISFYGTLPNTGK